LIDGTPDLFFLWGPGVAKPIGLYTKKGRKSLKTLGPLPGKGFGIGGSGRNVWQGKCSISFGLIEFHVRLKKNIKKEKKI